MIDREELEKKYPPNNKSEAKEKPASVVIGSAKKKKKGLGQRLSNLIIVEDVEKVARDFMMDVLVPAAKNTFIEFLETVITGDSRVRSGSSSRSRTSPYVSYNKVGNRETRRSMSSNARVAHDFDDLIFDSKRDAEKVLERMLDVLDQYDEVTVATLYYLSDIRADHTDEKYGWTSLKPKEAFVIRVREGYLLKLPKPVVLD